MLVCIILLTAFAPVCFADDFTDTTSYHNNTVVYENSEYYDTLNYDVDIVIDEDNTYHITETIRVIFHSPRHGIFRYIPISNTFIRDIGGVPEEFPSRASISKVKVKNHPFKKSTDDGVLMIKIGDPDAYVEGIQTYEISYQYRPSDDMMTASDEVYFNILPTGWSTPINNAKFTISLPKSFDANSLTFYCGSFGSQTQDIVNYKVNGTQITGELTQKIPRYNGVTLRVELPQGYFSAQRNYDIWKTIMWAVIIAVPFLAVLLWFLYGRDSQLVKPIAVSPPNGLTPADVGYIVDETIESRDMVALLFYWADKGYIQIKNIEAKKDFLITKLKDLPEDSGEYEFTMFQRLFRSSMSVSTNSLSGKFASTMDLAKSQVKGQFDHRNSTRLYTKQSKRCESIMCLLGVLPPLIVVFACYWMNMLSNVGVILVGIAIAFILYVTFLSFIASVRMWHSRKFTQKAFHLISSSAFLLITCSFFYLFAQQSLTAKASTYALKYYQDPVLPMCIALLSSLICLGFVSIMRKRTTQMNHWYGEILGFKEFIEYAEKDRLEALVQETPEYFYHVLPYAYVLGVSDTWAKKFENIAMPEPTWYDGGFSHHAFSSMVFVHSLDRSFSSVQNNLSVPPASSGGGSFSGGGGGGGFSGGGGGGGGGGSW